MNNELRSGIRSILSELLGVPLAPEDNPSRSELPSWDSLKHMELILRLEEQFHIRFSAREVAGIRNLDDLARIVEVKS